MKKVLFILVLITSFAFRSSAQKTSIDAFVGEWTSAETSVKMTITKKGKKKLKMSLVDKNDGEKLEIKKFSVNQSELNATIRTPSTDYVINIKITFVDENHLQETIDDEAQTMVYWERVN